MAKEQKILHRIPRSKEGIEQPRKKKQYSPKSNIPKMQRRDNVSQQYNIRKDIF